MCIKGPSWVTQIVEESEWEKQKEEHRASLEAQMESYVQGRGAQYKDPILDFLFDYYGLRSARLLRWSPGFGVLLRGTNLASFLSQKGFVGDADGVYLDPSILSENRRISIEWMATLLRKTSERPPNYGCYGMHEWAMVYRTASIRHSQETLRMTPEAIATFVEARPIHCTHFDAWRFFTSQAKPLNRFRLSRENQQDFEQPGCLHANMDLSKWAYKLFPWVGSSLWRDAFELAIEARTVDMQASPYDMSERGLLPICIETEEGRELYQMRQRKLWEKAVPIRARLLDVCDRMLDSF